MPGEPEERRRELMGRADGHRNTASKNDDRAIDQLIHAQRLGPHDARRSDALLAANTSAMLALQASIAELSILTRIALEERRRG